MQSCNKELIFIGDKININSVLWKVIYRSFKLSKQKINAIYVQQIIDGLHAKPISLLNTTYILLGLCKITNKKIKYTLEECNNLFCILDGKIKSKERHVKIKLAGEGINSTIINETSFKHCKLNSEVVEDNDYFSHNMESDMFRASSTLAKSNIMSESLHNKTNNLEIDSIFNSKEFFVEKPKKMIIDKVQLLKIDDIQKKIDKIIKSDNCKKELISNIEDEVLKKFNERLFVDKSIFSTINNAIEQFNAEVFRNSMTLQSAEIPENIPLEMNEVNIDWNKNIELPSLINFNTIDTDFNFTNALKSFSREEQAQLFVMLLIELNNQAYTAVQIDAFEDIIINKIM